MEMRLDKNQNSLKFGRRKENLLTLEQGRANFRILGIDESQHLHHNCFLVTVSFGQYAMTQIDDSINLLGSCLVVSQVVVNCSPNFSVGER